MRTRALVLVRHSADHPRKMWSRTILGVCFAMALSAQVGPAPVGTAPVGPAPVGEVTGRIRVTATLTKRRISLPQVYERAASLPSAPTLPPDVAGELRRVVVYLDTPGLPARPMQARMDQHQRRFEPEVVAVPVGSSVAFPNSDPIFHNVFSLSKAKPLDLGNYKAGDSRMVTFDQPGIVQLFCHLHPNMSGAILVTPNSWFTTPAADGEFTLAQVPPGRYTLVAWHKSAGYFRRKIEVRAGKPVEVDFEIPLTETASRR